MRFPGSLNVDMNEITMNLVPYPRMHFLLSSISPVHSIKKTKYIPRNLDQIFLESLSPENQLIDCDPRKGVTTAMGFLLRGDISFSDVSRNIEKISKKVNMIDWNSEGYKYGICSVPTLNHVSHTIYKKMPDLLIFRIKLC
jgi:tubulin epsilon